MKRWTLLIPIVIALAACSSDSSNDDDGVNQPPAADSSTDDDPGTTNPDTGDTANEGVGEAENDGNGNVSDGEGDSDGEVTGGEDDADTDGDTGDNSEPGADGDTETDGETEGETGEGTGTDTEGETGDGTGTETEGETGDGTGTDTEGETGDGTGTDADGETGEGTGTDGDSDADEGNLPEGNDEPLESLEIASLIIGYTFDQADAVLNNINDGVFGRSALTDAERACMSDPDTTEAVLIANCTPPYPVDGGTLIAVTARSFGFGEGLDDDDMMCRADLAADVGTSANCDFSDLELTYEPVPLRYEYTFDGLDDPTIIVTAAMGSEQCFMGFEVGPFDEPGSECFTLIESFAQSIADRTTPMALAALMHSGREAIARFQAGVR